MDRELLFLERLVGVLGFRDGGRRWVETRQARVPIIMARIGSGVRSAHASGLAHSDPAAFHDLMSFACGVAGEYDAAEDHLTRCTSLGGRPKIGLDDE